MENIVFENLYDFNFLSNIVYSPNGEKAFFVKTQSDKEINGYKNEIWLLDLATLKYKELTKSGEHKNPCWLDDENILFITQDKENPTKSNIFKISILGGEAQLFFSTFQKVNSISPLENGKFMLTVTRHCEGEEQPQENKALAGRDLLVFDEIYFWFNGLGIRNKLRNGIVIYDSITKEEELITKQYFNVSDTDLSSDKNKILYSGGEYTNVFPREKGIYLYDVLTSKTSELLQNDKYDVSALSFLGNGHAFFALNHMEFAGQNPFFYKMKLADRLLEKLPFEDCEIGGNVVTDCNYGGGRIKQYYNGEFYTTRCVYGDSFIYKMNKDGAWQQITKEKGSIIHFDISGNKILMTAMRNMHLAEIYSFDLETKEEKKITNFNDEYFNSHNVITPDYFKFKNSDGIDLEGYVLKPLNYKEGQKYPGVYEMHGGPKGIFGEVFHHEMQVLANSGYFVFYTNPRGSDGRGSEFAAMTKNLGKNDFKDFMEFYGEVLKRYSDIDEGHVGICGGSYGGFMCNWMIGHTKAFAAAASQRSISNYLTKYLTTDIGYTFNKSQLGTTPWEDFETVWETSPLKNAPFAKTPTLFIQSDEDYRCWMSDALQMFAALKMNGVDSRVALFKGENHELSRSGKPENRIGRLREISNWFGKYLKCEDMLEI